MCRKFSTQFRLLLTHCPQLYDSVIAIVQLGTNNWKFDNFFIYFSISTQLFWNLPIQCLIPISHIALPRSTSLSMQGTVRSPSVLPLGATIAVAAVGAVLLVAVLIALLVCCWCCCRHHRKYEYSTGEYRVTVQTWNATNPAHYTVSKSESFSSRSSIRSSFGLKPKVLRNKNQTKSDNVLGVYSTPLWKYIQLYILALAI